MKGGSAATGPTTKLAGAVAMTSGVGRRRVALSACACVVLLAVAHTVFVPPGSSPPASQPATLEVPPDGGDAEEVPAVASLSSASRQAELTTVFSSPAPSGRGAVPATVNNRAPPSQGAAVAVSSGKGTSARFGDLLPPLDPSLVEVVPTRRDPSATDVNHSYTNRSFVPGSSAVDGEGKPPPYRGETRLAGRPERIHLMAYSNFFHRPRTAKRNGTCACVVSAAAMGYSSFILVGEGTPLRSRENARRLFTHLSLGLRHIADDDDFVLFIDLFDVVFTLSADSMLQRYFEHPIGGVPLLIQGDITMFGGPTEAEMYAKHYGAQTIADVESGIVFPFANGGLIFGRKKHFLRGISLFFDHSKAKTGIDMGWISYKLVHEKMLQSGFAACDSSGAQSQNLNTGIKYLERPLFPRNGRIFSVPPMCARDVTRKSNDIRRKKVLVECQPGTGIVAPPSWRSPIWHFSGPVKQIMGQVLDYLRIRVPGGRAAVDRRLRNDFRMVVIDHANTSRVEDAAALCKEYNAPFIVEA